MKFFRSNEWQYRLLRTIVQAVIGVLISNADLIFSFLPNIPPELRPVITGVIMAILSPVMAEIGGHTEDKTHES